MDEVYQKLEFLDLTDIDESELSHLQQVLYTLSPSVKLPWEVQTEFLYGHYAVAPIAHPIVSGVFLPQPLYHAAPMAVQVGLVPAGDPPNGSTQVGLVSPMDGGLESHHMPPEAVYPDNVAQVPVMSVPQPPPVQPVITTIYTNNMMHTLPMSNVYVGNVTANVNVQSYVGTHLTSYPPQQPVYRAESHEMTSPNTPRGGSGSRRGRLGKQGNKRVEGNQFGNSRNSHMHEVLGPTAMMESPPSAAPPMAPQNYAIYPVTPIPYQQTFYTATTQPPHITPHPSAQHAAGQPIYLQNIYAPPPQPIYSTFPPHHQPPAGGAIVYTNAALSSTTMPSTEPAGYAVEEDDVLEDKEIPDLQSEYHSEVTEEPEELNVSEAKPVVYPPTEIEPEVIVNNDSVSDSTMVVHDYQQSESVLEERISSSEVSGDSVLSIDSVTDQSSQLPSTELDKPRKPAAEPVVIVNKQVPPGVPSTPFPPGQKNTPFPRQPSAPSELPSSVAPSPSPSDTSKSWASLFNKGGSAGGPPLFDSTRISGQKPIATVPPFPNSTGEASRKESITSPVSIAEASKNFPPLSHGQPPPSSTLLEDPNLYRLGEYLSKYQLEHKVISLQPRGLTNRSNWCYINSTLQALLACPPFYNLIKSLPLPPRRSGKSSTPIIDSMYQFMNEFVPLSPTSRVNRKEKAQRKDENFEVQAGAAFEPSYIYKMLSNIQSDTFKVEGRQEDAEEFLSCLLNAINDEMLELIKLVEDSKPKSPLSNGDITNGDATNQSQDEDEDDWKVMGPKNKGSITRRADFGRTPVSDIFRGELRSRVHRAGDEVTDSVQPFFTLQLDIEKAASVKDALELLVGRDQLEGVTCSKTNQEVEAWQQVTLQELPLVLILHLKWFDYKLDGCSKIVKTVEFPIDLTVDAKLMSSTKNYKSNQKKYKLFAVVYHDGKEATKGHYVTDVYHVGYGGWVRYDDSVVKPVQENSMLHPRGSRVPYLLYYRRLDTIGSATAVDKSR